MLSVVVLLEGLIVDFDIRRVEIDLSTGKEILGFFFCSNFDGDRDFATSLVHGTRVEVPPVFEVHVISEVSKECWEFFC